MSKILAQKPKTKIDSKITPHSTEEESVLLAVADSFSISANFSGMWSSYTTKKHLDSLSEVLF